MVLYDENGIKETITIRNKLGEGLDGRVYQISEEECLKVYKRKPEIDIEVLKIIASLNLDNYYEILKLYYKKNNILSAIKMKYYEKEDIDILTTPSEYTLNNLYKILSSADKLSQNNILIEDSHSGNIIMTKNKIIIADVDLYSFSHFYKERELRRKNIQKIGYLFNEIYNEAVADYHEELKNFLVAELIRKLFTLVSPLQVEQVYRELSKYKYPIDYIKKKTR